MYKLPPPSINSNAVFDSCISTFVQPAAITRYTNGKAEVASEYSQYDANARSKSLHLIQPGIETLSLKKSLLNGLYANHLSKIGEPARDYYDQIMEMPPNETCPLCGERKVSTLDHHLPKSNYPMFSIYPTNLIACCAECNRLKSDGIISNPSDQTLHPYFDDPNTDKWLFAEIIQGNPLAATFRVEPAATIDSILSSRIRYQFKRLNLAKLYCSNAASEISEIKSYVIKIRSRRGPSAVKEYFEDMADSLKDIHMNSWKTALYEALSADVWAINLAFT